MKATSKSSKLGPLSAVRHPRSSDQFVPRYTVPTVKHAEFDMVWGSFSSKMERAGLYFLTKERKDEYRCLPTSFAGTHVKLLPQ